MRILIQTALLIMVLTFSIASASRTYSAKNIEEVKIFAAVLRSEAIANGWTNEKPICWSVGVKDAGKALLDALRERGLRV